MKKLYLIASALLWGLNSYGQSVSYNSDDPGCYDGGPYILPKTGTTGSRNNFSNGTISVLYQTSRSRWEIGVGNFTGVNLFFYNTTQSTPNPPVTNWIRSGTCNLLRFVLPIELLFFDVKSNEAKNHLTWATASEKNNTGFDIERSLDGTDFQKIAFVKGAGTTHLVQQYTYTDASVQTITYYRLKQVDTDGKFEYSKVVSVESDVRSTVRVKPTFVNDVLAVEGAASYEIMDGAGRVLLQSIENQLNVQSLPQGFYVVHGRDVGGNPFVQKIIKN